MFFHEIQSWKNIAQCTIIAHCTLRIFLAWRTQCQFLKCTRVHNFDWIKLCHFSEKPSVEGRIPSILVKFVFDNRTWNSSVSHTFLDSQIHLIQVMQVKLAHLRVDFFFSSFLQKKSSVTCSFKIFQRGNVFMVALGFSDMFFAAFYNLR